MSDFCTAQLGDICDINPDTLAESSDASARFRYIDLSSVNEQKIDLAIESQLFSALPSRARRKVRYGDVLLGTVRPNLKNFAFISSSDKDLVASTGFAVLRSKEKLSNAEFIFHLINSDIVGRQLNALVTGSNYPAVNAGQVGELLVPIPPLPEQKKIAEVLSGIDNFIALLQAKVKSLENLNQALMQESLGSISINALHGRRQDSDLVRTCLVGEVFEVQLGKMLNKEARESGIQCNYLGNKNVQRWELQLDQLESMHFSEADKKKFALRDGDLLVCEGGDAGRCCLWEGANTDIYYQKAIHRIRSKCGSCSTKYAMYYLTHCKENGLLEEFISRTSIAHLTREKLMSIPISFPCAEKQDEIVRQIDTTRSLIDSLNNQIRSTANVKQSLSLDLLSGRKRISI